MTQRRMVIRVLYGKGRLAGIAVLMVLLVSGCSDENGRADLTTESAASSPGETRAFEGTIAEYVSMLRGCLEDHGVITRDPSPEHDPMTFAFAGPGLTDEQLLDIKQSCEDEIGDPYYSGMPEDELVRRYQARVAQFECLVGRGTLSGEPMTYELFVAGFERSGYTEMWAPAVDIPAESIQGSPSDDCPLGSF